MTLEDNLKELGSAMAGIGETDTERSGDLNFFSIEQAKAVIDYLNISLFKHYKLYEYLFHSPREELVISNEVSHLYRRNSLCRMLLNCVKSGILLCMYLEVDECNFNQQCMSLTFKISNQNQKRLCSKPSLTTVLIFMYACVCKEFCFSNS
uniref:Uncharacterized protein n=1 Tax=Strigops habroptila TaxID=2489341 RepID=A0A672U7I5_STRHB